MARKKSGGSGFLFIVLFIVIAAVLLLIISAVFFRVEAIVVTGAYKCDPEAVIAESRIEAGAAILPFINKVEAVRGIKSAQPYADGVEVYRRFPHTVEIHLTETVPLAFIPYQNANLLIDYRGMLLGEALPAEVASGTSLVRVTGGTLQAPIDGTIISFSIENLDKALMDTLLALRDREMLSEVTQIDIGGDVKFTYLGRFSVVLGTANDLERKLNVLARVIGELDANARGTVILTDVADKIARFIPE